uniref:Cystathionine gamma-lyase n=1 Tax=Sinocyclocheilus rhinocerous TaxID=307959 RepID=A0A673MWP8_9TELE
CSSSELTGILASKLNDSSAAGYQPLFKSFATDAIHVGSEPEQWNSRAVVPPISLSTTFKQHGPGKHAGFDYSRCGNPTRSCLERAVAALDGAQYCLALSSGMAATLTITHLLKAGDGILCMNEVYGGTNEYFSKIAAEFGLDVSFADLTKLELLKAALKPNTKMVWIETPTNPTLKVVDIKGCADIKLNTDLNISLFLSFLEQRPLALGADICMYSATKYMNGHSDVVMGLISLSRDDLNELLKFLQSALGAVPSPFDCYMCHRGLKTLHVRMKQHFKNAMAAAQFLEADLRVDRVIFPGLPSHPQHELTKRQCTGCPGMISFYIKGKLEHASTFLRSLKLFTLADSLGGVESLAEHPVSMTHVSVPENEKKELGISDTLIRLSVGLEDEENIIADLDQALCAAVSISEHISFLHSLT